MKGFVKYLGIMIDSELSWKHHIDFICHKISRSVSLQTTDAIFGRHFSPSEK